MILFSIYYKKKRKRDILLIFLAMLTLYSAFFAWRANLDIQSPLFLGVVERFWMQSDFVLILLAAVAFHDVVSIISRLIPVQSWHVDLVFVTLLVFLQLRLNLPLCDSSRNLVVHDFAVASLSAFPKDAVVLTEGDLPSNSFRFFHLVEHMRPDLTIVDQEMLTYDWFIPMLKPHLPGLMFPGDQMFSRSGISADNKKLFTFRQLLDANFDKKPLYGCIGVQDHEPSWKETYELRPFGICDQFVKKGTKFKLEEWLRASQKFSANWTHPFPESDASWEDVASSEMWRAKTVAGLYLMEKAEHLDDQHRKANWLRKAYQVFKEAMESQKHFPAYWHKNFALVCDKLRHFSSHSEKINLVKTTVIHFKAYLNANVVDHDKEAIQDAIYKLENFLKVLQGE
ncbi:transmembrane protein 260-like isoform X1 [Pomacea canaliculata]|uniref:transmembrane protein 260-like isoform X1 n=1 Tax=Pomacea canaliculata TaxID=400727 RepID=UPI000D7307A5|nr:transmembrane protein 260-like isoform X1 [Pomacea canaliculata]XP_025106063.1 transmembrane protein 260-like isoform X1 [Pomacea canaliculata]XP_025106064.1 transmembrane protein 260-like isoform X1 [Pomacea canaliculata]XP_025106065.1 transmembrane protein 260-like isoform X1 [Pomacea canaliculata]XP_025106066.1 transmembrane protein 260-like isoform X1 [Pomacea canaliculata]